MKITAIDFETANNDIGSVCSVGIKVYEDGEIVDSFSSLIKPHRICASFSPFNIQIHGIHPEDVVDAPSFDELYDTLCQYMANALVIAHNAPFDMGCIRRACALYDLPVPNIEYMDTVMLSRKACPQMRHHRLNDMCSYFGIELNHHDATSDANGCLMILVCIMSQTGIWDAYELCEKAQVKIHKLRR